MSPVPVCRMAEEVDKKKADLDAVYQELQKLQDKAYDGAPTVSGSYADRHTQRERGRERERERKRETESVSVSV